MRARKRERKKSRYDSFSSSESDYLRISLILADLPDNLRM